VYKAKENWKQTCSVNNNVKCITLDVAGHIQTNLST